MLTPNAQNEPFYRSELRYDSVNRLAAAWRSIALFGDPGQLNKGEYFAYDATQLRSVAKFSILS